MNWIFWAPSFSWIILPLQTKRRAFKNACVTRWKKVKVGKFNLKVVTMNPSWLKVDKATIFFRSISKQALILARMEVIIANLVRRVMLILFKAGWNRINKYTPAVTKVEEWTKALTGVGAAIAAGSQAEKGIWALLVILAKITKKIIKGSLIKVEIYIKFQPPSAAISAITKRIATSPIRFDIAVIIPALLEFSLL